ncbi:MAG: hypothetical protein RLY97_1392 [Pseudomonadota bacterium]|jgi:hypothetical protein
MARADRLDRLDRRRVDLEAEYQAALIAALERCAAGAWGLFGHSNDKAMRAKWAPVIAELTQMGADIADMRAQLAMDDYALHPEFLASRGPVASNAMGEPKQAQAWLARIVADIT